MAYLALIWAHIDDIFAVLFAIHAAAVAIVRLTPTPKDDAIAAKALSILEKVASLLSVKRKDFQEHQLPQCRASP